MKVQHQAAVGQQLVQVRRLDLAAQGGQVGKTEVIGDDQQNVWLLNCLRSHGLAGAEHEQAEGGKGFEAVHVGALVVLMSVLHVIRRFRRRAGQILATNGALSQPLCALVFDQRTQNRACLLRASIGY
ncbi:hypothetical protein D3C80_1083070 [compost metagenome]